MKLIIQIPCYNEEMTLAATIESLPRQLFGFDEVEVLVIDDGSTDRTAEVATELHVEHLVSHSRNRGLARAFATGLRTAIALGADVVVNTDGDNQYRGEDIATLLEPILAGEADMVVGDRRVNSIKHFSWMKKLLQRFGSWVVRWTSGTAVADATSGFRAISRETAYHLMVFSSYTYTLETIIQAGKKGLTVVSVPVTTNEMLRESRLIRSTWNYVARSAVTILRIFLMYEPLRVFTWFSMVPLLAGLGLFGRYLIFFLAGEGSGHIQSFIAASVLVLLSFQVFLLGLLADLIGRNRRILEETHYLQLSSQFARRQGVSEAK